MRYWFLAIILALTSMQALAIDKTKLTPPSKVSIQFFQAMQNGNLEIMDMLLGQGADINCKNCAPNGQTALMIAMSTSGIGATIPKLLRFLVENGADLNAQDNSGNTAIMYGIQQGFNNYYSQMYQVLYLIENGAQVNIRNNKGNNMLHIVYMGGYPATSAQFQDEAYAEIIKQVKLINLTALDHGLNINQQNLLGITPLHLATARCLKVGVDILLSRGADPSIKAKSGDTALSFAIESATTSPHSNTCNDTIKLLNNYKPGGGINDSSQSSTLNNPYIGNYSGNYTGDDNGSFQISIAENGNISLNGRSSQNNQTFSGSGKVNSDGSLGVALGSISSGAIFQGSVNSKTGSLYGTWKNAQQAGNFSGSKQQGGNPLQVVNGLLNGISRILGQ